jgi:hypothetical protein
MAPFTIILRLFLFLRLRLSYRCRYRCCYRDRILPPSCSINTCLLRWHLRSWLFWSRQGWRIVNDFSVAHDLNAIPIPMLLLIPGVEAAAIDILTDNFNRLTNYLVDLFVVQARNLQILHPILMCVSLGI